MPSLADMNKDIKHTGGYGWQGDFEASMSDDGSWSASVSYVAPPRGEIHAFLLSALPCSGLHGLDPVRLPAFTDGGFVENILYL